LKVASVAQLVEHLTAVRDIKGLSPDAARPKEKKFLFLFLRIFRNGFESKRWSTTFATTNASTLKDFRYKLTLNLGLYYKTFFRTS